MSRIKNRRAAIGMTAGEFPPLVLWSTILLTAEVQKRYTASRSALQSSSTGAFNALVNVLVVFPLVFLAGCKDQRATDPPAAVLKANAAASAPAATQRVTSSETADEVKARLLKRYAATYDHEALLAEPALKPALQALLGADHERLIRNLSEIRTPIDVLSGALSATGMRKNDGMPDEAILCVRFHPLQAEVGFLKESEMIIYARQPEYRFLSSCLQHWVFMRTNDTTGFSMPPKQGASEFTFQYKVVAKP
jgi:hypothetical protein